MDTKIDHQLKKSRQCLTKHKSQASSSSIIITKEDGSLDADSNTNSINNERRVRFSPMVSNPIDSHYLHVASSPSRSNSKPCSPTPNAKFTFDFRSKNLSKWSKLEVSEWINENCDECLQQYYSTMRRSVKFNGKRISKLSHRQIKSLAKNELGIKKNTKEFQSFFNIILRLQSLFTSNKGPSSVHSTTVKQDISLLLYVRRKRSRTFPEMEFDSYKNKRAKKEKKQSKKQKKKIEKRKKILKRKLKLLHLQKMRAKNCVLSKKQRPQSERMSPTTGSLKKRHISKKRTFGKKPQKIRNGDKYGRKSMPSSKMGGRPKSSLTSKKRVRRLKFGLGKLRIKHKSNDFARKKGGRGKHSKKSSMHFSEIDATYVRTSVKLKGKALYPPAKYPMGPISFDHRSPRTVERFLQKNKSKITVYSKNKKKRKNKKCVPFGFISSGNLKKLKKKKVGKKKKKKRSKNTPPSLVTGSSTFKIMQPNYGRKKSLKNNKKKKQKKSKEKNIFPYPFTLQPSVTSPTSKIEANSSARANDIKHIYFDDDDMTMLCGDSDSSSLSMHFNEEKDEHFPEHLLKHVHDQNLHHPSPICTDTTFDHSYLNIMITDNTTTTTTTTTTTNTPAAVLLKKRLLHKKQISEDLTENLHMIVNNGRKIDNRHNEDIKLTVTPVPSVSPSSTDITNTDVVQIFHQHLPRCISDTDSEAPDDCKTHIQSSGNSISNTNTPTVMYLSQNDHKHSSFYNYKLNPICSSPIVPTDDEAVRLTLDTVHNNSLESSSSSHQYYKTEILSQLHSVTSDQLLQLMIMGECDIEDDDTDSSYTSDSSDCYIVNDEDGLASDVPSPSFYIFDHMISLDSNKNEEFEIRENRKIREQKCTVFSYTNTDGRNRKTRTFLPLYNSHHTNLRPNLTTADLLKQFSNSFSHAISSTNTKAPFNRQKKLNLLYKSKSASARNFGRNRISQRRRFFSHAEKYYGAGDSDESCCYSDDCFEEYEQRKTLVVPSIFSINDADEMILSPVATNTVTNQDRQSLLDMFAYSITDYSTDDDSACDNDNYSGRKKRRRRNRSKKSNGSVGNGTKFNFNSNNMITESLMKLLDEDIENVGVNGDKNAYNSLCSQSSSMINHQSFNSGGSSSSSSGSERKECGESLSGSEDVMQFFQKVYSDILPPKKYIIHHNSSLSLNDVESNASDCVLNGGLMVIESDGNCDDVDDNSAFFNSRKTPSPMRYNIRQEKKLSIIEKQEF